MIGKEEFKELIQEYFNQSERIDKLCEILPGAYAPIFDWGFRIFDKLINTYFDEEGEDWIEYFLYDNPEKCYYKDDKRIPLESIDDLWKLIKDNRK